MTLIEDDDCIDGDDQMMAMKMVITLKMTMKMIIKVMRRKMTTISN